jgi:lipoyl(octanoyl) transferase
MLEFIDWGLIDYEEALTRQLELVEQVAKTQSNGFLIFCTHPAVVTLGRKTQPGDVYAWQGPIKEISRGGRATYHGPSQLVVYPIYNLEPKHDIGAYLRNFENAIVKTLETYGVAAVGKSLQKKSLDESASEETGVWVGSKKVASLGIAVKKWVTFHGAAINLDFDKSAFQGMKPCGFEPSVMTSLEELTGKKIDRQEFTDHLKNSLQAAFAAI